LKVFVGLLTYLKMNLKELKTQLLKDPKFAKEYYRFDPLFELGQLWIIIKGWLIGLFGRGK